MHFAGKRSNTDDERSGASLAAHASRRSRRSLLSMRLSCFHRLDLILRRPRSGRLEGWAAILRSAAIPICDSRYRYGSLAEVLRVLQRDAELGFGLRLHFVQRDAVGEFDQRHA